MAWIKRKYQQYQPDAQNVGFFHFPGERQPSVEKGARRPPVGLPDVGVFQVSHGRDVPAIDEKLVAFLVQVDGLGFPNFGRRNRKQRALGLANQQLHIAAIAASWSLAVVKGWF